MRLQFRRGFVIVTAESGSDIDQLLRWNSESDRFSPRDTGHVECEVDVEGVTPSQERSELPDDFVDLMDERLPR